MRMRLWGVLSMLVFAGAAHATVTGVGSGCNALPAGTASLTVNFTSPVPAGVGVAVTLVTSQNAPLGTVSDVRGNTYPGSITRFNTGLVFNRIGDINTPIQSGDAITFPFTSIPVGGMAACAQLFMASDLMVPTITDAVVNGNSGSSNAITVSTAASTTTPFELVHASAFTLGDPGTVTTDPSFANATRLCSGGNTVCLLTATREVAVTGTYTYTAGLANSRDWGAVIATYVRVAPDPIFKDGFE